MTECTTENVFQTIIRTLQFFATQKAVWFEEEKSFSPYKQNK
jgi:hypothetical protein